MVCVAGQAGRVRSGQIRAVCTRNARQEANLNKQHKQRTTPASFYDAAIRDSLPDSRFAILSSHSLTTGSSPCLGFSHGPQPTLSVCVCPFYEAAAITASTGRYRICFSHFPSFTISARFYDGNLRVSADRSSDRASERFFCFRGLDQLTWWCWW